MPRPNNVELSQPMPTASTVVPGNVVEALMQAFELLIGHADVAAEIPARDGEFFDRRHVNRRQPRHVGRICHCREQCDGSGNGRDFHAHHDITLSSRGVTQRLREDHE